MKQGPALLLLLTFALTACSGLAGEPQVLATLTPAPRAPADLASGARIFAARCSSCHGSGGAGDGELALSGAIPAPGNFTQPEAARGQSLQQWLTTIRDGRIEALMPPWRDALTAAELRDVALYSYTLHYRPELLVRGQSVLEAACADGCAGLEALGDLREQATLDALSDEALRAALPDSVAAEGAWAAAAWLRARHLRGLEQSGRPFAVTQPVFGDISGRISNGTADAAVPPGLKVVLLEFGTGQAPALRETLSTADGSYRFAEVLLEPGRSFSVLVEHGGRRFPSARVGADPARPQLDLPVTIYEAGADLDAITVSALVQQLSVVEDALQIVQVARYRNNSDRVYSSAQEVAPGQFASLALPLPAGARDLTLPDESGRYVVDEAGRMVTDTLPVLPGVEHLVQLAWRQPWDGTGISLDVPLAQALDGEVRLLLPPTLTLDDADFGSIGPQQVGAALFDGYGAMLRLEAGDSLRYTLRAQQPTLPPGIVSGEVLVLGAALTIGAVAVLLALRRRRSGADKQRDILARQIAELDAAHERGAINHDLYRRQRAELQQRLTGPTDGARERDV